MTLGDKIRWLRTVEGSVRGLGREMTQQEVVQGIRKELRATLSQSYLSQIESGARPHLTHKTRSLLARFFKVHPGYLVDDPEGYHTELTSEIRQVEENLDIWLMKGAEQFRKDRELSQALQKVAKRHDSRRCVRLLGALVADESLLQRLTELLLDEAGTPHRRSGDSADPAERSPERRQGRREP